MLGRDQFLQQLFTQTTIPQLTTSNIVVHDRGLKTRSTLVAFTLAQSRTSHFRSLYYLERSRRLGTKLARADAIFGIS